MKCTHPSTWKVGTSYDPYEPNTALNLNEIKKAGFNNIEIVLSGNHQDLKVEGLRTKFNPIMENARNLKLDVWSVHLPFGDFWDISELKTEKRNRAIEYHYEWLDWVSSWNVGKVVIHPSYEPISNKERSDRLRVCKQSLGKLAKRSNQLGIEICVECLPRTCLGKNSAEIEFLTQDNEKLSICCDVNHLLNETPQNFIRQLGTKISTVHLSDYDGIDERHWMPGEGVINWNETLQMLADSGYEGPFMFEVSNATAGGMISCWNKVLKSYEKSI